MVQRHLGRVSGPLLDRIDLHVEVPAVPHRELSATTRAYHRILEIARTLADLEGSPEIATAHVAEAVQYRSLDRLLRG